MSFVQGTTLACQGWACVVGCPVHYDGNFACCSPSFAIGIVGRGRDEAVA